MTKGQYRGISNEISEGCSDGINDILACRKILCNDVAFVGFRQ